MKSKEAGVHDTLACALFVNGKTQEAIVHQKKAVEFSTDKEVRGGLERTLKKCEEKAEAAGK